MTDRHDPIVDDTPNKRRKLNPEESSGRAWDSQEDSADKFNENDFETEATMPLSQAPKRQLAYTADQMRSDFGMSERSSSQTRHVTQPTQPLKHTTQPTQPLPPTPSNVQVERSSPVGPSQRPPPQSASRPSFQSRGGLLAGAMAPAGTTFRRPQGVQPKPQAIDIDSDDDPPIHRSDEEEATQGLSSNLKLTNFKRAGRGLDSSPNRVVQETPRNTARSNNMFENMLSEFGYKPTQPSPRPVDDMVSSYGSTSRAPRPPQPRQTASARAAPVGAARGPIYRSLADIPDLITRNKVKELQGAMGEHRSIQACMDALQRRKFHLGDTMEELAAEEDIVNGTDELTSASPMQRKGVAQSKPQSSEGFQAPRATAKQQVKAPAKTIAEKYAQRTAKPVQRDEESSDDDEDVQPKKGRILQGRKPTTVPSSPPSSPPPVPQQRSRLQQKKQVITIDSDEDDDSGVGRDARVEYVQPEPAKAATPVNTADVQEMRDERILKLINEATAHDLAELSGQPKDKIQFVLDKRPFNSLDEVCEIVQAGLTKSGKPSKKSSPVGERLVEDCREVMTGYEAIDELVVQCEKIARPLQEALRGWGVGESTDGELQLMSMDETHDSGIGTPSSSVPPEDAPAHKDSKNKPKGNFIGQPSNMNQDLVMKNYQLVGLNWLYLLFTQGLSCILADDMGLGKTCQIIGFLSYLQLKKVDGVHLIVVPGSTLENWLREFEKFAPDMNVRPYYGLQSEREELQYSIEQDWSSIDVIVTTYDMAVSKMDNKFLRKMGPFSVCVYDEAHALRNPNSQRYQQLVRIGADFKVLLTGTPLQNNLQELVAILAFIMPEMFSQKEEDLQYIFKHKASTKDTASAALLSSDRIGRARTMMTPFILRRKKAQVLDLPAKTSRIEYCDMTDSQGNYYADLLEAAQKFFTEKASGAAKGSAKQSSNVLMALRKAAIHPLLARRLYDDKVLDKMVKALQKTDEFGGNPPDKIRAYLDGTAAQSLKGGDFGLHKFCYERESMRKKFALKHQEWMDTGKVKKFQELVTKYAANGDRVLVFSQFTTLMDILEAVLETMGVKFMRLDGSTKMDTRQDMIDQFYEDESITVFMLSTRAGGAGINLAAANKVIIFDSGFNPQDDIQAENRAHRVGQTRPVEVVRLVTKGTIEEQIHALGESKLALDERVAGEGATEADAKQAEKAGEQMVEKLFCEKLKGEPEGDSTKKEEKPAAGDLKDAFKSGMEAEGVKVESKQAQY